MKKWLWPGDPGFQTITRLKILISQKSNQNVSKNYKK